MTGLPSSPRAALGALAALLLVALVLFWPLWTGRSHLVPFHVLAGDPALEGLDLTADRPDWRFFDSSPITMFYAEKSLAARQIRSGEFPLWNPFNGLGSPLLADSISQPLSPFFAPLLLWPGPRAFSVALALQALWAGLGMVLLLRRLGMGALAQASGGVLFAFSPFTLNFLGYSDVWAAAWIPWMLWAFEGLALGIADWTAPALVVALTGMCGHLEVAFFGAASAFAYGLLRRARGGGGRSLLPWLGAPLGALGLSLWWILPFLELVRGTTSPRFAQNVLYPYHPTACLLPGSEIFWSPVLLLLAAAGWGVARYRKPLLATLPLAVWGVAMMFPWPEIIQRAATFDFACGRYGRGLLWVVLVVWASAGLDGLRRREVPGRWITGAGATGALSWLAMIAVRAPALEALNARHLVPLTGAPPPPWGWLSLSALAALLLIAAALSRRVSALVTSAGLAGLLLAGELSPHPGFDVLWNRSAPASAPEVARALEGFSGRAWFPESERWKSLPPNLSAAFGVRDVRACSPLWPQELVRLSPSPDPNKDLFQSWEPLTMRFLGVEVAFAGPPGGHLTAAVDPGRSGRGLWVPRAVLERDVEAAARLALAGESWRETVFLEEGSEGGPTASWPNPGGGSAKLVWESPNRTVWRVAADRKGWFVLRDLYWPGWRATVDGEPARVLRADGVFRAVALDAGEHEVVFRYLPIPFLAGSVASVATAVMMAIRRVRRGRQEGGHA